MYRNSHASTRGSGSVRVSAALSAHLNLIDMGFDEDDGWGLTQEENLPETEDVKANKLITKINALPMNVRASTTALYLLEELDRINLLLVSDNTLHRLAMWAASVEGE